MPVSALSAATKAGTGHGAPAPQPSLPVAVVPPVPAAPPATHGHRHPLLEALVQTMELDKRASTEQAVLRFAHALMQELQLVAGPEQAMPGGGRAWGRQDRGDLGSRIAALATAVAGDAAAPAAQPRPQLEPPRPLTQTRAALWLSQVPSARLLEAFAALRQVQPALDVPAGEERRALAALLAELSAAVTPKAAAQPWAGSIFHAQA